MAELIEFPARKVAPDSLPQPGDTYQAYGLACKIKPPMLGVVFPDWSMGCFAYDRLGFTKFIPLSRNRDRDGDCEITLTFRASSGGVAEAVITGRNLHAFFRHLCQHDVHWIWEFPKGRAAADDGAPVVHGIVLREIAAANPAAVD